MSDASIKDLIRLCGIDDGSQLSALDAINNAEAKTADEVLSAVFRVEQSTGEPLVSPRRKAILELWMHANRFASWTPEPLSLREQVHASGSASSPPEPLTMQELGAGAREAVSRLDELLADEQYARSESAQFARRIRESFEDLRRTAENR